MTLPSKNKDEYGYELAYRLACEKLAGVDSIEQQCLKAGARYEVIDSKEVIFIDYLSRTYQIDFPDIEVSLVDSVEKVTIRDKILILHYLTSAKGTPLSYKLTAYKELPEGSNYFPTFCKRTTKPLLAHFGNEPHLLVDAAARMGGQKADYGDTAVTINAFSRVPITLVVWKGDAEFPPEGSILFDRTISDYLSIEDINVLCEIITWRLVRYLSERQR